MSEPLLERYYGIRDSEHRPRGLVKRKWKKYHLTYRLDVYKREFGIQIDHVWYTADIGDMYAYQTVRKKADLVSRTSYVFPPGGNKFYDSFDDIPLGGARQTLGG